MPKRYEVEGRIYEVPDDATLADVAKLASGTKSPTADKPVPFPMGMRLKGGYEGPEEGAPEGVLSRTVKGMIHPSPEMQLGMDVLPLAGAVAEAAPNAAIRVAQGVKAGVHATGRGAIRAAGAVADTVSPEVVGVVSPRAANVLRVVTRLRDAMGKKAPALADVVEEIQQAPEAPVAAPSGKSPQQLANEEAIARWRAEGKSLNPVPLNKAADIVRAAAKAENVKLTAEEYSQAVNLRAQGKTDADILDAVQVRRQLLEQLKTKGAVSTQEMRADMRKRAMSGQKSLMGEYGDEPEPAPKTGNPFR